MIMFTTKSNPIVSKDGKIKKDIEIKSGVLTIKTEDGELKYENEKWYTLGEDKKWYFLGYGANPSYETENEGVLNQELFDNVFEPIKQG